MQKHGFEGQSSGQDVLEGLPRLPEHWIAEASLPQLELLPQCDAFITHGGANSIHEALQKVSKGLERP